MRNDLNIYEAQYNLLNDLDKWLSFQDLSEEEQNEICENIASEEYENIDDYDLAGNEGIYENASEKMGYIRKDTYKTNWEHATDAGELIASIGNFTLSNGRTPVCVKRILKELKEKDIETAFENYEYNLKRELYDDMRNLEECNKEYWIEEILKPELKGKYNRETKQFIRDTTKTYYIN
jgi:hypothetical protein